MKNIFEDIHLVAFDIMGVILTSPSLVKEGLYPMYKDKFDYEYIKGLYREVRSNVDGDSSLWEGLKENDPERKRKELLDSYSVDEDFREFVLFLDNMDIRKGIISNMPKEWGDYFVEKLVLISDFNPILFSSDVGISKPDFGKYDEFIQRSGLRGSQILFIDDKLRNLERASQFGMKTVLYDRGNREGVFTPDLVIEGFHDLIN